MLVSNQGHRVLHPALEGFTVLAAGQVAEMLSTVVSAGQAVAVVVRPFSVLLEFPVKVSLEETVRTTLVAAVVVRRR